mmetsp:Transcript_5604/g.8253  ORF Transcript_5604/g.8253 Transcript_5604/m.8253 type:complete len:218 (+) Transcript_5604:108-761(+)
MGSHLSKRRNRRNRETPKDLSNSLDYVSTSSHGDLTSLDEGEDERRSPSTMMRQRSNSTPPLWIRDRFIVPSLTTSNSLHERRMRRAIMELQSRDITPEDYSLLCSLDEKVQKKTIKSTDSHFQTYEASLNDKDVDCAVCLEPLNESPTDQKKKDDVIHLIKLPHCKHSYHAVCITKWLTKYSTKCPTCGHNYESLNHQKLKTEKEEKNPKIVEFTS